MCGRYAVTTDPALLAEYNATKQTATDYEPAKSAFFDRLLSRLPAGPGTSL